MRKMGKYRTGVARTWFLSYILVLAIPLLITGILFVGVERIISSKITSMNESILYQIKGTLDDMFSSITKNALQIQASTEVNSVLEGYDDLYQMYVLKNYLAQYTAYSDYIDDIAIWLEEPECAISAVSSYRNSLLNEFCRQYGMSWSECNYRTWKNPVISIVLAQQARGFYQRIN